MYEHVDTKDIKQPLVDFKWNVMNSSEHIFSWYFSLSVLILKENFFG